ncbi:hypothetical protein AZE42_07012, partial [Rhizopogon vesiculosus]
LCLEIPHASGRLLETGTEQFLALKREGKLGDIPIVIVFTKYDVLVEQVDYDMGPSLNGLSEDDIKERIKKGSDIPHVAISGLAREARLDFVDRTVWACLHALHADIVAVWNFHDPYNVMVVFVVFTFILKRLIAQYLSNTEFRTLMVNMVDKIDAGPTFNPYTAMKFGLATVASIATIVSTLVGPVAPIVVPTAARVLPAKWVHGVYQLSNLMLQRFISYTVDLTIVLQTLCLLLDNEEVLSRRVIKLALMSYHDSPIRGKVHSQVQENVRQLQILDHVDRVIVDRIKALMKSHSIDAEEISDLRAKIPPVRSVPDEPWIVFKLPRGESGKFR